MNTRKIDTLIVGGGPAGLAAAVAAYDGGVRDLLIVERDVHLGGILQQCIHNGFGLQWFKEELTGPEYAQRFVDQAMERHIPYMTETMVLEITKDKHVYCVNPEEGVIVFECKTIILAMGCRERVRGNLKIPGTRPAGVYSAGLAQRLVNLEGVMPGKEVVILGSGDIGLIMARRMKWEGADVKMVCEIMPYSSGLARNIQQCLKDNDIPLHLNTTVVKVHGKKRVEGVTIARVDENRRPIKETEQFVKCDTLMLSVGLLPENELSRGMELAMDPVTGGPAVDENRQTSISGVYACGNVLHVHDIVDFVSKESMIAGAAAARYVLEGSKDTEGSVPMTPGTNVRYIVPQRLAAPEACSLYFRVGSPLGAGEITLTADGETLIKRKFIRAVPGEMEELPVKQEIAEKLYHAKEVVVSAVEKEA